MCFVGVQGVIDWFGIVAYFEQVPSLRCGMTGGWDCRLVWDFATVHAAGGWGVVLVEDWGGMGRQTNVCHFGWRGEGLGLRCPLGDFAHERGRYMDALGVLPSLPQPEAGG